MTRPFTTFIHPDVLRDLKGPDLSRLHADPAVAQEQRDVGPGAVPIAFYETTVRQRNHAWAEKRRLQACVHDLALAAQGLRDAYRKAYSRGHNTDIDQQCAWVQAALCRVEE